MKRYILIAAAILSIASCTNDDIKEVSKGEVIDFHTTTTRATVTTTDNLQEIWVTAIGASETNYYTDLSYSRDGDYFKSETPYYWPSDGSSLDFYAYAPAKSDLGTISIDKNAQTLTGFSPAANITDQVDFIIAKASGSKEDAATGVELIFDHMLSQIEVKAYTLNKGYTYKVKGVRIAQVASAGDFDFSTKTWTPSAEKTEYMITYDTERTLGSEAISLMATDGDNAMLIPQQLIPWDNGNDKTNEGSGSFIAVLINITSSGGTQVFPEETVEYDWLATPLDTKWEDGFKYTYNLDLSEGGLVAPDKPIDPDDPDGPDGPYTPGEDVLGGERIKFTSIAEPWSTNNDSFQDPEM